MTRKEARDEIKNLLDYIRGEKELKPIKTREDAEAEERKGVEALEMAIKVLEQEPKTGHWVKTPKAVMGEGYLWYCDKCGHQVYQDSSRPYPSEKYCPNCGARMGREE